MCCWVLSGSISSTIDLGGEGCLVFSLGCLVSSLQMFAALVSRLVHLVSLLDLLASNTLSTPVMPSSIMVVWA